MGSRNNGRKIILLLMAIIALLIGGMVIIDIAGQWLGVYVPLPGLNLVKKISLERKLQQTEDPYLLWREELNKKEESIKLREELLVNKENENQKKEVEINKKLEALTEREKQLEQKALILDQREKQYEDNAKNIREQAEKLYNMPPGAAVLILEKQNEADIVSILRAIDSYSEEIGTPSTASYLLTLFENKEKSANVFRKLKYSTKSDADSGVEILDDPDAEEPPAP